MQAGKGLSIMDADPETVGKFGLCGYKDPKKPGFSRKLAWIEKRFEEGLKIKVLHSEKDGAVGSIEYIPGEYGWRGVRAAGYMLIHCLFMMKKDYKGKGYGSLLIEACEEDARERGMHGVAVVASKSTWMAGQEIFLKNGYELVEQAPPHHQLLVKRFGDAPLPAFRKVSKKLLSRYSKGLTILHSDQCPYAIRAAEEIPPVARAEFGIEPTLIKFKNCRSAQDSPNPYGIFSIIWNGELVADHAVSKTRFKNIMKKILG